MSPHDAIIDALERATAGLITASDGMITANRAMIDAYQAARDVITEHEELRVTVHRLEQLVLQQSDDIRALRQELRGNGGAP